MDDLMGATPSGQVFVRTMELVRAGAEEAEAVDELASLAAEDRGAVEDAQHRLLALLDERPDDPDGTQALHLLNEVLRRAG